MQFITQSTHKLCAPTANVQSKHPPRLSTHLSPRCITPTLRLHPQYPPYTTINTPTPFILLLRTSTSIHPPAHYAHPPPTPSLCIYPPPKPTHHEHSPTHYIAYTPTTPPPPTSPWYTVTTQCPKALVSNDLRRL